MKVILKFILTIILSFSASTLFAGLKDQPIVHIIPEYSFSSIKIDEQTKGVINTLLANNLKSSSELPVDESWLQVNRPGNYSEKLFYNNNAIYLNMRHLENFKDVKSGSNIALLLVQVDDNLKLKAELRPLNSFIILAAPSGVLKGPAPSQNTLPLYKSDKLEVIHTRFDNIYQKVKGDLVPLLKEILPQEYTTQLSSWKKHKRPGKYRDSEFFEENIGKLNFRQIGKIKHPTEKNTDIFVALARPEDNLKHPKEIQPEQRFYVLLKSKGLVSSEKIVTESIQHSRKILLDDNDKGRGSIIHANNIKYRGEINTKGKAHGQGEVSAPNGSHLKGHFINDQFQGGEGELKNADGSFYKGKINKDSRPHGKGEVKHPNGAYLKGEFQDGQFVSGHGKIIDDNGYYIGAINATLQTHGKGKYTWKNGSFAEGKFKNNKFISGKGALVQKGKGKYKGGLDSDFNPHGQGSYYSEDNSGYYKAVFNHGSFSKAYGTIKQEKATYEGELNNKLQPHGKGSWSINQGKSRKEVKGVYVNGKLKNKATAKTTPPAWLRKLREKNQQQAKNKMNEEALIKSIQSFVKSQGIDSRVVWSGWRTLSKGTSVINLLDKGVFSTRKLGGKYRLWFWQPASANSGNLCMRYKTSYYIHHTGIFGVEAESITSKTDDYCPSWVKVGNGNVVSLGFSTPYRNYKDEAIIRSGLKRNVFLVFMGEL